MKFPAKRFYRVVYFWFSFHVRTPAGRILDGPNVCKELRPAVNAAGETVEVQESFCCAGFKEENSSCVECVECVQTDCPRGYCGEHCTDRCDNCPVFSICDPKLCCLCNAGYTGPNCDQNCRVGYYGPNCNNSCACSEHSSCDTVRGTCMCFPGWTGTTCESEIRNSTCAHDLQCDQNTADCVCKSGNGSIENNMTTTRITDSGKPSKGTDVFTFTILFIVVMGIMCVLLVCIYLVHFILICRSSKSFRPSQVQETENPGHYDEISPYNELSLEELARLRQPYYSSPVEIAIIRRAFSLPYVISLNQSSSYTLNDKANTRIRTEETIPKYLSLPNLQQNEFKVVDGKTYDILKTESAQVNRRKGYLNPYSSLIKADVSGSGYLHPYNALKIKQRHGVPTSIENAKPTLTSDNIRSISAVVHENLL